ncbi:MAG: FliM/FliN family flagellar motor C-terminal domain-containing protein, partial [Myxococcota bacterium]
RSLSPVESRIAGRMCADLLMETERNWPESTPPRIAFNGLSTTHRELDPSTSTVPVYSATFDFGAVDAPLGLMVLALPVHALASFASAEPEEENPEPPRRQTLDSVMPVEVEVVVELTHLKLTVNELRELMPGDVLNLGSMRDAVIKVNGLALFEGQAGVSGGVRSVKLRRRRIP